MNICLWKCRVLSKYWVRRAACLERGRFSSKACVDFAVQHTFKVKCAKNLYRDISGHVLRSLKDFCMHAKICAKFRCEHYSFKVLVHWCYVLWKNIVGHTEISVFACSCLCLQKLFAKMQYFQSTLHNELNTLKKSSTSKGGKMCSKRWELCRRGGEGVWICQMGLWSNTWAPLVC